MFFYELTPAKSKLNKGEWCLPSMYKEPKKQQVPTSERMDSCLKGGLAKHTECARYLFYTQSGAINPTLPLGYWNFLGLDFQTHKEEVTLSLSKGSLR